MHKLDNLPLTDVHETDADGLFELTDEELANVALDNVDYFPVMQVIGQAMANFVVKEAAKRGRPPFSFDLVDAEGKELLVTRTGDLSRIKAQLSSQEWLDGFRP